MQLLHRVAFVTGGAQGLGKAFSEALLQKGARVCLTDIQVEKGKQVENEFKHKYGQDKVAFFQCDVASSKSLTDSFKMAATKFGHIDIMVNNAGIGDESRAEEMVNINLVGTITGSMLAIEHMRKDKGGQGGVIINISSTGGLTGVYFIPVYCATKFGVVGFHKSWSNNPYMHEMGIQFGCLCPAFTDTAIMEFNDQKMLYLHESLKIVKNVGINKVESVVQAFLQLVESENCNGDIITVTTKDGIQYHTRGRNKASRL